MVISFDPESKRCCIQTCSMTRTWEYSFVPDQPNRRFPIARHLHLGSGLSGNSWGWCDLPTNFNVCKITACIRKKLIGTIDTPLGWKLDFFGLVYHHSYLPVTNRRDFRILKSVPRKQLFFFPHTLFLSQVYAEVVFVQQQLSGQSMEEALKIVEANRSVGHGTTLLSQLQLQVRVVALVVEPLYRCKGTLEVAVLPCFSQDFRPFVTWKWGKMWIIVRAKITWNLKYGVFARVFFPVLFGDVFG